MNTELKHMMRRHFFVREQEENGEVVVCWDYGVGNEADVLTKALPVGRHKELSARFRDSVGAMESYLSKHGGRKASSLSKEGLEEMTK